RPDLGPTRLPPGEEVVHHWLLLWCHLWTRRHHPCRRLRSHLVRPRLWHCGWCCVQLCHQAQVPRWHRRGPRRFRRPRCRWHCRQPADRHLRC
ncbi:hypothetical protein BN1708_020352, partial [Verticillium longisporum]